MSSRAPLTTLVAMFAVCQLGMFTYGAQQIINNTALKAFHQFINESLTSNYDVTIEPNVMQWVWTGTATLYFVSMALALTIMNRLADSKVGRRGALIAGSALQLTGHVLASTGVMIDRYELYLLSRVFIGLGSGILIPTVTLFVQECTPTASRGTCACFQELSLVTGCFQGALLAMTLGDRLHVLLIIPVIPDVIMILMCFLLLKETPKHLLLSNADERAARNAIIFYYGVACHVDDVIGAINKEKTRNDCNKSTLTVVETMKIPVVRKGILLGCAALCMQTVSGIVIIYQYSTHIFLQLGLAIIYAQYASLLMVVVNLIFTLIAAFIVERSGRRVLLLTSDAVCILTVVIFCISQLSMAFIENSRVPSIVCVSMIMCFNAAFSFGVGPIAWFVNLECVQQQYRSTAAGMCQLVNRFVGVVLSLVSLPMLSAIGAWTFIVLATIPSTLLWLYLYYNLPETKGKEVNDVVAMLTKEKKYSMKKVAPTNAV